MILDFFRNDLLELFPGWLSELNDILYLMFINEYNGVKLLNDVTFVSYWSKKTLPIHEIQKLIFDVLFYSLKSKFQIRNNFFYFYFLTSLTTVLQIDRP